MNNQALRYQLRLWTVFLVVVPSLLIMSIYTVGQIQVAKQQNLELITQRVEFQKWIIENWIGERANDVRKLSQLSAFRDLDEAKMKRTLALMQRYSADFDSLSYIDKDGFFKMSTLSKKIKFTSTTEQPYFKAAVAGKEYISDVVIGRNSGLPIINFSAPVYDDNGLFQGVILGSVQTTTIETLLRENWIGKTGEILLVNRKGIMIAEPRYINILIDKGLIDGNSKMKLKLSDDTLMNIHLGDNGTAAWVDYQDKKVLGAYQYMPKHGWTLVGSISQAEILAPIYAQLWVMAGSTICLVLLILPLATLLTNRIKRPIDWLISQSNHVAAEDYALVDQAKSLGKMPHELGTLCDTFVKMSDKIKNTVSLLKENETNLESKVLEIQNVNTALETEINQRQMIEQALSEAANERARIEQIASLGILAAGMAHEINQPLNAIKVASGAILYWHRHDKPLEMGRIINDIESIAGQADRIDQIIKHMRSFAKTGRKLQQIPVRVNESIHKVIQLMSSQIKADDIDVDLTLKADDAQIMIVPSALEGIIINLLMNALQALDAVSQDRKRIEIETWVAETVVLEIRDNGPGINDELLNKIFEPLFSTKSEEKGMGLGLSIVYSFVESNQGTIQVSQNTYGGATFCIRFPIYLEEKDQ